MKPIFNSLGSNFPLHDVILSLKALLFFKKNNNVTQLVDVLKGEATNEVVPVYKGRDAIELACRVLLPTGSKVLTQAFSCYAVEEGMKRAGMQPIYIDIAGFENEADNKIFRTNVNLEQLKKSYKKHPDASAVFIQHSLGIPAGITSIQRWCKKNNVILIEDVAQAFGAVDKSGEPLGSYGDVVIFSFGRDKIIDAVSGGAVLFKELKKLQQAKLQDIRNTLLPVNRTLVVRDMLYPLLTYVIRLTHSIIFGKLLFFMSRKLGLLTSPVISPTKVIHSLDSAYIEVVLHRLKTLSSQLEQRRKCAEKYFELLSREENRTFFFTCTESEIGRASNLRFSIVFEDQKTLSKVLTLCKAENIHISDRWYRSPVDCGSQNCLSEYQDGSCKQAEFVSRRILNLPTHQGITVSDIERIVKIMTEVRVV